MATKYIAHASIDEHSKIKGGKAGDQTKKEVCIRSWYNKPWSHVLRINNDKVRKQFGNNMIDIAKNDNIGYDQNQRNSLLTKAIKVDFDFTKIKTKCECDCSSSITVAILGAIYKVLGKTEYEKAYKVLYAGNNCRTTSTLRSGLNTLKLITVYSDKAHTASTDKAVFGDIYISEGHHVVCYINNGKKLSLTKGYTGTFPTGTLRKGSKGTHVKSLQKFLNWYGSYGLSVDGSFGTKTQTAVKAFQKATGLTVDGVFGPKSLAKAKSIKK